MNRYRIGFTAIEILISISVMAILAGIAAPGFVSSARKGRINTAANAIMGIASQAKRLAISRNYSTDLYGVVVVGGSQPYVALTHGPTADASTILMEGAKPLAQVELGRNVEVLFNGAPVANGVIAASWMYQFRSGMVVATNDPAALPVNVQGLLVRNRGGRYGQAVAVYRAGLINFAEQQ
jgi:prepilin-type N-terminal cleavage/methylation domain-containing protein